MPRKPAPPMCLHCGHTPQSNDDLFIAALHADIFRLVKAQAHKNEAFEDVVPRLVRERNRSRKRVQELNRLLRLED